MGSGHPLENNKYVYGFLKKISIWTPPPLEKIGHPPLENNGPPLDSW